MSAAPALGFSLVANLGDNRQITCQCFVDVTEPLPVIDARIDLVQAVIDRQQAKYQIKDWKADLEKHQIAYQRMQDDLAAAELRHKQETDTLGARLLELGEQLATTGLVSAAQRNALKQEQKAVKAKLDEKAAERQAHISNVLVSKERFEEEIDRLKAKIAEAQALIER